MRGTIFIIMVLGASLLKAQDLDPITIGTKHALYSDTLGEMRDYWVNLPASYYSSQFSSKTYPVLVLLDGNIHFQSATGMVNYMSRIGQIPEMIVVALQNVGESVPHRKKGLSLA